MLTNTDDYLTTAEAAALLGVSARTVDRWRLAGDLVAVTVGGRRVYYHRPAVLAYRAYLRQLNSADREVS